MAGKPQIDYGLVISAYRSGATVQRVAADLGVSRSSVLRIIRERLTASEREALREEHRGWKGPSKTRLAQQRKIESGSFRIERAGAYIFAETGGLRFLLDAENLPLLHQYAWRVSSNGRLFRRANDRKQNIYIYHDVLGVTPSRARPVDHINRDRTDNRKANLRVVSPVENARNRGPVDRFHPAFSNTTEEQEDE